MPSTRTRLRAGRAAGKLAVKAGRTRIGRRLAPRAGKTAGKTAVKLGKGRLKVGQARMRRRMTPTSGRAVAARKLTKGQAKLVRQALRSREPGGQRYLKYALFAGIGIVIGTLLRRSGGSSGQQTWGSGSVGQEGGGAPGSYSDPSSGPLIGSSGAGIASDDFVPEEQDEVEQRIRTAIGEDERTRTMPRVNVEVNDGFAELRGVAPSEDARQAAGEIAASVVGVREVSNLITVA